MLGNKSDYLFVGENALARIAIEGKPMPVRTEKLVLLGEDAAYTREAVLEREYCCAGATYFGLEYRLSISAYNAAILRIGHDSTWFRNGLRNDIGALPQKGMRNADKVLAFYAKPDFVVTYAYNAAKSSGDDAYNEAYEQYEQNRQSATDSYNQYIANERNRVAPLVIEAGQVRDKAIERGTKTAWEAWQGWSQTVRRLWNEYARGMKNNKESYDNRMTELRDGFASTVASLLSQYNLYADLAWEWNSNVIEMQEDRLSLTGTSKAVEFLQARPLDDIHYDPYDIDMRLWRDCESFQPSQPLLADNYSDVDSLNARDTFRNAMYWDREEFTRTRVYTNTRTEVTETTTKDYSRGKFYDDVDRQLLFEDDVTVWVEKRWDQYYNYEAHSHISVNDSTIVFKYGKRHETEWIKDVYAAIEIWVIENVSNQRNTSGSSVAPDQSEIRRHLLRVKLTNSGVEGDVAQVDGWVDSLHRELDRIDKAHDNAIGEIETQRYSEFADYEAQYEQAIEDAKATRDEAYSSAHEKFMKAALLDAAEVNTQIDQQEAPEGKADILKEYERETLAPARAEEEKARTDADSAFYRAMQNAEAELANRKSRYDSTEYSRAVDTENARWRNERNGEIASVDGSIKSFIENNPECDLDNRIKWTYEIPVSQFISKKLTPQGAQYSHDISVQVRSVHYTDVVYDLPSKLTADE